MYYVLTDYQCNWCKIITETDATVESYSFDPWGRRRHPDNWNIYYLLTTYIFDRGYTGHELLDAFGLINMNGRVYDPIIARFLSPDNYVQSPDNSGVFNRYSYCFNNQLIFTDPDGQNPILIMMTMQAIIGGLNSASNGQVFFKGFAISAATGAISAGVRAGVNAMGLTISGSGVFVGAANMAIPAAIGGSITYGLNSIITDQLFDWKGYGLNVGMAAIMGGVQGGIDAYDYNHLVGPRPMDQPNSINLWTGKPTLNEQLRLSLYAYSTDLYNTFGEAGVGSVLVGNKQNLRGTGMHKDSGEIWVPDPDNPNGGELARGVMLRGKAFGLTTDGYSRLNNNKLFLSKNTVRALYKNSILARETLFHEWYHSNDYFEGTADWIFKTNGFDGYKTRDMLEFRAHSFNYSRVPTVDRMNFMEYYAYKYWGINP